MQKQTEGTTRVAHRWSRRAGRPLLLTGLGLTLVVSAACSSSGDKASSNGSTSSKKLISVTAAASFPYAGGQWSCLYDYGKAKGFYAKHGVDPTFSAATGSVALIDLVAAGKLDFGWSAAASNVLQAVSKGATVKIIGVQERDSPNAVISSSTNPIAKPADLKGKKIAYGAATLAGLGMKLMLSQNGMSDSDVQLVNIQPTSYASALKSGSIDGYVSFPESAFPTLEGLGVTPKAMYLRDFGFNPIPADTYITNNAFMAAHPDVVKDFLAGTHDTWAYLAAHPDQASAVGENCVGKHVGVKADLVSKQVTLTLGANSAQLKTKNFMNVDEAGLQSQIDLLSKNGQLPDPKPASDYFTNQYLPKN